MAKFNMRTSMRTINGQNTQHMILGRTYVGSRQKPNTSLKAEKAKVLLINRARVIKTCLRKMTGVKFVDIKSVQYGSKDNRLFAFERLRPDQYQIQTRVGKYFVNIVVVHDHQFQPANVELLVDNGDFTDDID